MAVTAYDATGMVGPTNGELVVPISLTSGWFAAILPSGGPETQDAATITNPTTQITAATRRLFTTSGRATRLTLRLKYDRGVSAVTSPVIVVFGRVRFDVSTVGSWMRLRTLGNATTATLTIDLTNDVDDGTYKYTDVTLENQTFDGMACNEFLVGVQTAFAATGTVNTSDIQCKLT